MGHFAWSSMHFIFGKGYVAVHVIAWANLYIKSARMSFEEVCWEIYAIECLQEH